MSIAQSIAGVIEIGLNRYLSLNPDAPAPMQALIGKTVAVELTDLNLCLFCVFSERSVSIHSHYEDEPDTRLMGSLMALAKMGIDHDADNLFSGDVQIKGDVELGRQFQALLDTSAIDWEEQLSKVAGDVAAYRLGLGAKYVRQWGTRTRDSLREDMTDYLQEESRILPHPVEAEDFALAVDVLRDDCARLAARIHRLQAAQEDTSP